MHVITVSGNKIKQINAIMFNDKWYSKRDDCVKIGMKHYPKDHPDLAVDFETKEINLKGHMTLGIIGFNGNKPEYGHFTRTQKNEICYDQKNIKVYCYTAEMIPKTWVECLWTGYFHNPEYLTKGEIALLKEIKTVTYHTDKGYNIEDNAVEYARKIEGFKNSTPIISKKTKRFARLLGARTFGIENEIAVGTIPEKIQEECSLVLCRDGSVDAGEFVSVPMSGAKGVHNIVRVAEEMSKRTITDLNCSYHIHIGNIDTSKIFLLSLYKLVEIIQDELFTMLPYYKTFWKGIKKKNYNKKLENLFPIFVPNPRIANFKEYISYNYAKLFRFLSCNGTLPSKEWNRNPKDVEFRKHPVGNKWNITSRYYAVNFVNTIFSKRNTVEFRCFQNTTNPTKMVTWLYICNAIISYAEVHASAILTKEKHISLKDVMNIYKDINPNNKDAVFMSDYLNAYIEDRKSHFIKLLDAQDYRAKKDTEDDKAYTFYLNGKSIV